jgi:hypothetical protein
VDNRVAHQLVADRYELLASVGRGGFGVVWRALDTLLQREVAVKEIRLPAILADREQADIREKVLREARAAARLNHPGAVTVFDVIDDDGRPVIVMELVEAPNLSQLVADRGPLPPKEVARIGLEVLDTLAAAHEHGIVHRDVKPANVMVADSGRVRLGDFGVAAILDDPTVTTSGAITGSPAYMAPEQATNRGAIAASDLWSLGATMYFAVEGQPPFDKGAALPTLASIVNEPPRPARLAGPLGPVIDRLLVKRPEDRLSEPALRAALTDVAAGPVPGAARPSSTVAGGDTAVLDLRDGPTGPEVAVAPPQPVADVSRPSAPVAGPPAAPRIRPAPDRVAGPPPTAARRRSLVGPAVVAGVAVVALVLGLVAISGRDKGGSPAGSAAQTSSQSTKAESPSTTARRPSSTAAPRSSGAVPSDWVGYTDPQTGYAISRPTGWAVRTDGTLTDFRDPATGAYLRVDHREPPGPSPEGAWRDLEPSFAAENPGYQQIQITPTTYAGFRAAIWEFTYTGGGAELHVADLGFVTPGHGFALYFQTRSADWDRLQPVFEAFKASFKAPA